MPDRLGRYLRAYVEELFVASVLGVTLLLFLLIPYKLAFLNFSIFPCLWRVFSGRPKVDPGERPLHAFGGPLRSMASR